MRWSGWYLTLVAVRREPSGELRENSWKVCWLAPLPLKEMAPAVPKSAAWAAGHIPSANGVAAPHFFAHANKESQVVSIPEQPNQFVGLDLIVHSRQLDPLHLNEQSSHSHTNLHAA